MNNYYTLIYLTKYLKNNLISSVWIDSSSPHRNVWEGIFENSQGEKRRLIFSADPNETALFSNKYRAPKKSNVLNFFDCLNGQIIEDVEIAANDRFIYVHFNNSSTLLFQLFGNRPNILLVQQDKIIDAFKNPDKITGAPPPVPRSPQKNVTDNIPATAKKKLLQIDQKLPRHLLDPIIEQYQLQEADMETCKEVISTLTDAMIQNPSFRILENGNLCLIPDHLLKIRGIRTCNNINEAIQFAYYETSDQRRFSAKISSVQPAITREIQKKERTLRQLSDADKTLERANQYEQIGHLLMANAHKSLEPGQKTIELNNFYEGDEKQVFDIKPDLSIAENAQLFYEKSTKAKARIIQSKRREKELLTVVKQLQKLDESIREITSVHEFEEWEKNNRESLEKHNIYSNKQQKSSLPFRKQKVDGFDVWIGKNAKSNDELIKRAHKEDVWMHARGTPGSHVVIRMNNNSEFPPKQVILKTASYAAWHSSARGSSLVPVIVTKMKYVTKPKGAPPGLVRVQRESVEMVSPVKP